MTPGSSDHAQLRDEASTDALPLAPALGASLDALDDLLHGGYGALAGHATATVVWRDIAHSREALGRETTRAWLQSKLDQGGRFNGAAIHAQLTALALGQGQTYFEIVMEIFGSHPQITLVPG